jgi:hypothetical protein
MFVGILFAVLSGILANIGVFLQKLALDSRKSGESLLKAFIRPRWIAGLFLLQLGWFAQLAALRSAPLYLVQPLAGSGIAVLVILARRRLGEPVGSVMAASIAALIAGGAVLAWASSTSGASAGHKPASIAIPVGAAAAVVPLGTALSRMRAARIKLAALSATAGVLYGTAVTLSKPLSNQVQQLDPRSLQLVGTRPEIYLIGLFSLIGAIFNQIALAEGRASIVAPSILGTMTVVPVVMGIAVMGEPLPKWPATSMVWTGIVVIVLAIVFLATSAEPAPHTLSNAKTTDRQPADRQ